MDKKSVKILMCSKEAKDVIEKIDSSGLLGLDNKNCSRIELFLFAMALGIEVEKEKDLIKSETLVRGEYVKTKDEAFIYATFIGDLESEEEIEKINDTNNVFSKAQRYANMGFVLINDMFEKAENILELELLEELDEAYKEFDIEI